MTRLTDDRAAPMIDPTQVPGTPPVLRAASGGASSREGDPARNAGGSGAAAVGPSVVSGDR